MSKTYQIVRDSTGADEFDGDVFQVVEWTLGYLMDNAENRAVDRFYAIPARMRGGYFERALIEWAVDSLKGKFRIEEVE